VGSKFAQLLAVQTRFLQYFSSFSETAFIAPLMKSRLLHFMSFFLFFIDAGVRLPAADTILNKPWFITLYAP
jgi:hypothetical protein